MKILWVSPTPSHPTNAGNRAHIHNLGQRLIIAGHDICFLLYNQENATKEDIAAMRSFWPNFFVIQHKIKTRKKSLGDIWGIDDWFNEDLEQGVKFILGQTDFDAIICEYVFMSKALTLAPDNMIKILSTQDRMSNRDKMLMEMGLEPDFFYTDEEQESIALQRADIVLAIQQKEKVFFSNLTAARVLEIGYQSKFDPLTVNSTDSRLRVGLMGSANSLNRKSAQAFMDMLAGNPELAQNIKLVAAGRIGEFLAPDMVENLGFLENEEEFYRRIDVAINPMLAGTGLKIKTVSAFQHGCPFLSTKAGSEGINAKNAAHLCETPWDFLPFLQKLADPEKREKELEKLRMASHELACEYARRQDQLFAHFTDVMQSMRKSVLLVTEIPFWEPGVGNHTLILQRCRELARHFRLRVFFFGSLYGERDSAIRAAGMEGRIHSYKKWEASDSKEPFNAAVYVHPSMKGKASKHFYMALEGFLKQYKFNVIILEYIWNAYLLASIPYTCLTILDSHDLMAFRKYSFGNHHDCINISFKDELAIFDRFSAVMFVQKNECREVRRATMKTLPIYCTLSAQKGDRTLSRAGINFAFIGAKNTVNFEALFWFLENVWRLQTHHLARFHIFGGVSKYLNDLPQNVISHGIIEQPKDIYACCEVMINPIIFGSGIKIKSIEALAFGKPLLSSPEGAKGIENPYQCGIVVAEGRSAFISGMLRFTYDPVFRNDMADKAWNVGRKQFSREKAYSQLIKLINAY